VALRVNPDDLTDEQLTRFVAPGRLAEARAQFPREMEKLRNILAADLSYLAVSRHLAGSRDFDLFFFYRRGPDMISHYFWPFMEPDKGNMRRDPAATEIFGETVRLYYEWSDEIMGEVIDWFETTRQVAVLSDHGFYGPRKSGEKGAAEHSEWGIFMVRSPLFEPGFEFGHVELLDTTPTPGRGPFEKGQQGRAGHGEEPSRDLPAVAAGGRRSAVGPEGERDEGVAEEIRKQLRSLGYIK